MPGRVHDVVRPFISYITELKFAFTNFALKGCHHYRPSLFAIDCSGENSGGSYIYCRIKKSIERDKMCVSA